MGCHLLGHQQFVTQRSSRNPVTVLACLLVVIALACMLWALRDDEAGRSGSVASDRGLSAAMQGLGGRRGEKSDAKRWLDDLAASTEASPAVEWTESRGLVDTASAVLKRYERIDSVTLETQGYLDLKGNVWGAIVTDGRGWVDMVTVMTDEADSKTTVRVVRLVAERLGRS